MDKAVYEIGPEFAHPFITVDHNLRTWVIKTENKEKFDELFRVRNSNSYYFEKVSDMYVDHQTLTVAFKDRFISGSKNSHIQSIFTYPFPIRELKENETLKCHPISKLPFILVSSEVPNVNNVVIDDVKLRLKNIEENISYIDKTLKELEDTMNTLFKISSEILDRVRT